MHDFEDTRSRNQRHKIDTRFCSMSYGVNFWSLTETALFLAEPRPIGLL